MIATLPILTRNSNVRVLDYMSRVYTLRRSNMVAYYPFNGLTLGAGVVKDYGPNGLNQNTVGNISPGYPGLTGWVPGYDINGVDGTYIYCSSMGAYWSYNTGTMSFALKTTVPGRYILWFYNDPNNQYVVSFNASSQISFTYRAGGVSINALSPVLSVPLTSAWFVVTLTWDIPGDIIKIYINGVFAGSATGLTLMTGPAGTWVLGSTPSIPATTFVFDGGIGHFSAWNTLLTDEEIYSIGGAR